MPLEILFMFGEKSGYIFTTKLLFGGKYIKDYPQPNFNYPRVKDRYFYRSTFAIQHEDF